MVKKLLKHELFAIFRVLVFYMIAVLIFAVLGRISVSLSIVNDPTDNRGTIFTIMLGSFYVFAIFALVIGAWALGVSRFYQSLFTGEGYMTFSLPATPMQLVWAKLLSSIIAMASACIVSILSAFIFLVGWDATVMGILGDIFGYFGEFIFEFASKEPLAFVEVILLGIVSIPMSMLVVYAIISVGQLFTAHRKGMTLLIAFGVYFVGSLFNNLVISPVNNLFIWGIYGSTIDPHLGIGIHIIVYLAVDIGCFFLIRYILRNKVNLIA